MTSMLEKLQQCKTKRDLAILLDVPLQQITWLVNISPQNTRYTDFCISKKNGKSRQISNPNANLKFIQKKLADILLACDDEILKRVKQKCRSNYGFSTGVGIFHNAKAHRNKKYVFNADIIDFFDQFNFGRVRGFFKKNRDFLLVNEVATLLTQIVCHDDKLPQGAPSSPVVTNLITRFFDYRMNKLAGKNRCRYTRYADDLTFSTNQREFPSEIAVPDGSSMGWIAGDILEQKIVDAGFQINPKKTRMSLANSRQMVTGLVCNKFPNIPRDYYINLRAVVHSYVTTGSFHLNEFCENYANNCNADSSEKKNSKAVLHGRMQHVHFVKNKADKRTIKEKQLKLNSWWKVNQRYLFFRTFIDINKPLIVTEGITDIFYLREALKNNTAIYDHLSNDGSGRKILAKFFSPTANIRTVLALPDGSSGLKRISFLYYSMKQKEKGGFKSDLAKTPVIFVTDNDEGLSSIKKIIKDMFGSDVSISKNDDFYHIVDNLYLVKTPHKGTRHKTCIESFLPDVVLNQERSGKKFNGSSTIDPEKEFGKSALTGIVKERNLASDLVGMDSILKRISLAVDHYQSNFR